MDWLLIRLIDKFVGIPAVLAASCFAHRSKNSAAPSRILLIKFWGLGNIFMMLPSVYTLKKAYPNASIDILSLAQNEEALRAMAPFNNVLSIDTKNPATVIRSITSVITSCSGHYDLVIDHEEFARISALLTICLRAPHSIGFKTHGQYRHFGYSTVVSYEDDRHITETFAALIRPLGITADQDQCPTPFRTPADSPVQGRYAVLHPGTSGNFPLRRWPASHFAALGAHLHTQHALSVVITGSQNEKALCESIARMMPPNTARVVCESDLATFCATVKNAVITVAADTLAVHVASYYDRPVIGLFGPNTPLLYGPWSKKSNALFAGLSCSPCITNFNDKFNVCRHRLGQGHCMQVITPASVCQAADRLLKIP
jgi:ADP-heptose:LPS heptosyltransferase